MIWAIILAAGESRRMGQPKQLLPYGRSTVIETVIGNVLRSAADNTLVVLGASSRKIRPLASKFPVHITRNPLYRAGMLSSVQWGIRHLPSDARAALVFLGDQPWITPDTADRVISAYRKTGKGLVLPVYKKGGGHPLLVDMKYRQAISVLDSGIGLKKIVSLYPADVLRVSVPFPRILDDLDTPGDYRRRVLRHRPKS
jgi:molybdenum cofactor cytidylyltransferase